MCFKNIEHSDSSLSKGYEVLPPDGWRCLDSILVYRKVMKSFLLMDGDVWTRLRVTSDAGRIGILFRLDRRSWYHGSHRDVAALILTEKTTHRYIAIIDKSGAQEPADTPKVKKLPTKKVSSKKRPADISFDVPVLKMKRTSKRKLTLETVVVAQEAVPIQSVPVSTVLEPMVEDQQAEFCTEQPADELPAARSAASTEERHWFDLSYEELIAKWAAERPITSPADSYDEIKDDKPVVDDPDSIINQVQEFLAQNANDDLLDADEQKSLEDILLEIPVDVPLPSAGMEITKIVMGKTIKIPGITEKTWFLNSPPRIRADDKGKEILIPGITEKTWFLNSPPRIRADDKGKEILVEKNPIKGNPAQELYSLICADIDLLVALRAKVIDDVALFLNSFSLKKLATINIDEMYKEEEQVLSWGETESPQVAIQRKSYILLKYRKVLVWKFLESWRSNFVPGQGSTAVDRRVIELLSDHHVSILEELTTTARAHGLIWKKPCCSTVFEGSPRDRGAVIARTTTNTRSSCWIRTMILVDGVWTVEPCADKWVKIPRQVISNEVHRQRQYDDTLPTVRNFFRLMRKRWADICLEVVEFCASRRLLPIGSLQFCMSSTVVESDFRVAPHPSPIFAFRVSLFCSIFVDFSLFNWIPSADISDFLSSIALDRTSLRSVHRYFAQSVVPSVQLSLDQRPPSPTSTDSSSSLRFDTTDVDATASSIPPISQDFSAALADLQAILSEKITESQSGISSKLHNIEQVLRDSLSDQAAIFKNLSQEARQEGRNIDDADEGVSFLVVDRIGDIYRNLPRRADAIVTTVGSRHKCQQGETELGQTGGGN
ncbi:MATE efflux family protein 5-like [Dorcoceras hygrometricum]|uniref:MATE efflux family protein 5-like n=1 Tax=Dorcoceras hygrometricum TaxID=472368 RepID=A0A2Z7BUA3_9LAMI|nr:MATE efflux family protein 5-like [Dorcoceras hygrometricum]